MEDSQFMTDPDSDSDDDNEMKVEAFEDSDDGVSDDDAIDGSEEDTKPEGETGATTTSSKRRYRVKKKRHGRRHRSRKDQASRKSQDSRKSRGSRRSRRSNKDSQKSAVSDGDLLPIEREHQASDEPEGAAGASDGPKENQNPEPVAAVASSKRRKVKRRRSKKPAPSSSDPVPTRSNDPAGGLAGAAFVPPPTQSSSSPAAPPPASSGTGAGVEASVEAPHVTHQNWEVLRQSYRNTSLMARALDGWYPGVRESTLAHIYDMGRHRPSEHLCPELSSHGLGYADMALDRETGSLRPVYSRSTFALRLEKASGVPTPGDHAVIVERKARMCLYDGERILSNIHTIAAEKVSDFAADVGGARRIREAWRFAREGGFVADAEHDNVLVVRFPAPPTPEAASKMCLLIELTMSFVRYGEPEAGYPKGKVVDSGEVSAGWTTLALFPGTDRSLIDLKSYRVGLHGGTPQAPASLMSQEEIDAQKIPLWKVFAKKGGAKLKFKLGSLSRSHMHASAFLPATFLASFSTLPVLAIFRQLLAERLLKSAPADASGPLTHPSYDPALTLFPMMLDEPDMIEWIELLWARQTKSMSKSERRSLATAGPAFVSMISDLWPLVYAHNPHPFSDPLVREARQNFIQSFVSADPQITTLSSDPFVYLPFSIQEGTLDPLANLPVE